MIYISRLDLRFDKEDDALCGRILDQYYNSLQGFSTYINDETVLTLDGKTYDGYIDIL